MEGLSAEDKIILVRVKIERAKKHLRTLEKDLARYGKQHFEAATSHRDPKTGQIVRDPIKRWRKLPFDALAAAGDVIQNLRSALDYLAQQLVWTGSGKEPSRSVQFPISKDAPTYEKEKARRVEGMHPEAIKAIDALKPYRGGNESLWKIHELNNIDKHRLLFTYANDCFLTADWLKAAFPYNLKSPNPTFPGAFDSEVEKDMGFEIDQVLSQSQGSASMIPTLHELLDFAESLVLDFKPHLQG